MYLKSGKLSKNEAAKLCWLLLGDELEGLTDGATVTTFDLIARDTQRLVNSVQDDLKQLGEYHKESNDRLEQMQKLMKQIVVN